MESEIIFETEIENFFDVNFVESYLKTLDKNEILDIVVEALNANLGKNFSKATLRVYGNEGTIPHFHIKNTTTRFEVCVEIYRALYFQHGTKQGTLTDDQCGILNEFLKQKNPNNKSNWEEITTAWEMANSNSYNNVIPKSTQQPDYTKLNSSIPDNTGSKSQNKKRK